MSTKSAAMLPVREYAVHFLMTVTGGIFGGYALLLRHGHFGSAATGNLIQLMLDLNSPDPWEILIRVGAFLLFAGAAGLSTWLSFDYGRSLKHLTLVVELVGILLEALIPLSVHSVLALYPVFFISSFQWGAFAGTERYPCSTIFVSNNTKQTIVSAVRYLRFHEPSQRERSLFYGASVLIFAVGAYLGAAAAHVLSRFAILCAALPILIVLFLLSPDEP